jgi:hypothetical protein
MQNAKCLFLSVRRTTKQIRKYILHFKNNKLTYWLSNCRQLLGGESSPDPLTRGFAAGPRCPQTPTRLALPRSPWRVPRHIFTVVPPLNFRCGKLNYRLVYLACFLKSTVTYLWWLVSLVGALRCYVYCWYWAQYFYFRPTYCDGRWLTVCHVKIWQNTLKLTYGKQVPESYTPTPLKVEGRDKWNLPVCSRNFNF